MTTPFTMTPRLGSIPGRGILSGNARLCPIAGALGPRRRVAVVAKAEAAGPSQASALNAALLREHISGPAQTLGSGAAVNVTGSFDAADFEPSSREGQEPSSWEQWLAHFDQMDELAEDAAHYQVELNSAVKQERYSDAARHKKRLQEIQSADTVAAVQRQLQAALASEQYGPAAELRDKGLVGMAGWWAGKAGPDDFSGHLLHVKAEFGRWTGRVYMARDIAQMNGWRENKLMQLLDRTGSGSRAGAGAGEATGLSGGTIGTPLMEVFVKQGGAPAGSSASGEPQVVPGALMHQAVALRPPAPKADKAAAAGRAGKAGAEGSQQPARLNPASVVRLCINVGRDGSARISVLPPKPVKSEFNDWEEEEMRATLAALAADDLKPSAPSSSSSASRAASGSAASTSGRGSSASTSSSGGKLDGFERAEDDDEDEDGMLTELTRVPAQVAMLGRDRFTFTVLEEGASASGSSGAADGAAGSGAASSGLTGGMPRWAAVPIEDESGDEEESQRGAAAAAEQQQGRRGGLSGAGLSEGEEVPLAELELVLPLPVEVVDVEGEEERAGGLRSGSARGSAGSRAGSGSSSSGRPLGLDSDDDEEDEVKVSFDMLSTGFGRVDAVATSVSNAEEQSIVIEIPVGRLMRQQQRAAREAEEEARRASGSAATATAGPASSSGAQGRRSKDTFDRLAERVSELQAARAGRPVPSHNLAIALRVLAQRLLDGELASDGSSSATATVPAAPRTSAFAASPASAVAGGKAAATRITYGRIPTDLPRSDPLNGLYLGAFGPHGPELIQLTRTMMEGEETVVATKITGDPNVPAGEMSFRAKVGRRHRLDARDVYPEELGITARYRGEGRVAMAGYKSPRWVEGELLVFAVGASPVTGGAELGFVWNVPGEKRFLILLNKLNLKETALLDSPRA